MTELVFMSLTSQRLAGGGHHGTLYVVDRDQAGKKTAQPTRVWTCNHDHRLVRTAKACADAEAARRGRR